MAALFCLLGLAALAYAQGWPPVIPCTFTAAASYSQKASQDAPWETRQVTIYSVEGHGWATVFGGGTALVWSSRKPAAIAVHMPLFDRLSCYTLPIAPSLRCFVANRASKRVKTEACPLATGEDSRKAPRCEYWTHTDGDGTLFEYAIISGETSPRRITEKFASGLERSWFFDAFNSSGAPDSWIFETEQPCADLTAPALEPRLPPLFAIDTLRGDLAPLARSREKVNEGLTVWSVMQRAGRSWKAQRSPRFDGRTLHEVALSMRVPTWPAVAGTHAVGTRPRLPSRPPPIAESFDARSNWTACVSLTRPRDQKHCNSGWAMAAAAVLTDRFCIASAGALQPVISSQRLLSCYPEMGGSCLQSPRVELSRGADFGFAALAQGGSVADVCAPFVAVPNATCDSKCAAAKGDLKFYKASAVFPIYTANPTRNAEAIQREIAERGPVAASMWVFDDFLYYSSGVYSVTPGSSVLGHQAVKIIGWGTDPSLPKGDYWLCANSWGKLWGESGFFRITRGMNECGIETQVLAATPHLDPHMSKSRGGKGAATATNN